MNQLDKIQPQFRQLLETQRLAVLSTSNQNMPYASLVAFASASGMKELIFATARSTRKYANLADNPQVALLIDSRSNQDVDFHKAIAATATGIARELPEPERKPYLSLYLDKHPHLVDFVTAPTCALIRVRVSCYYLVSRFQNVVEILVT